MANSEQGRLTASAWPPSWVEVGLIFVLFFVVAGGIPPDVNEAHYLAKARHYWDPDWCRGDLFLESADAHLCFYWTVGVLTCFLPLEATAWVGRAVTWWLLAWSWQRMSRTLIPGPLVSLLTAGLFVTALRWGHMAGEWVVGGVEAKCLAYAFVFLALEALAAERWSRVWLLLGVASSFHVLVGGWSAAAAFFTWCVTPRRPVLEDPGAARFRRPAARVAWSPSRRGLDVAGRPGNRAGGQPDLRVRAAQSPPGLAPTAPAVRGPAWGLAPGLARHALRPVEHDALPAGVPLCRRRSADCGSRGGVGPVAPVPAGAGGPVVAFLLVSPLGRHAAAGGCLGGHRDDSPLGAAARVGTAGTGLRPCCWLQPALRIWRGLAGRTRDPVPSSRYSPCSAATGGCDRTNIGPGWPRVAGSPPSTPHDALVLTPRQQQTFKWYAERAEVVNWKDLPQDAPRIVEWRTRMRELYPLPVQRRGLAAHGAAELLRLAQRYGFQYLVLDRSESRRPLAFPRVFPGPGEPRGFYEVYRVPADETSARGTTRRIGFQLRPRRSRPPMHAADWDLPGLLARRLTRPLRRLGSQSLSAPELSYGRHAMPPLPETRPAAVLILLYPHHDEWTLPLTVRPPTLSAHAGQISLPGGSTHPDETCERAAMRECEEELGVPASNLTLLGRLTPLFVYNSNYYVTPCVASLAARPELHPNAAEVADLLELPVGELANPKRDG